MGYRSDVKAIVYPGRRFERDDGVLQPRSIEELSEQYQALKTLCATQFSDVVGSDVFYSEFSWDDKAEVLRYSAPDVKWYPSYSDVQQFHKFLEDVEELGYSYEFIRVGESGDDVSTQRSADHECYLGTRTEITCEI